MSEKSGTIFVVDDNESVRTVVEVVLRKEGYRVETFESGESLLRSVQSGAALDDVRVIILDVLMPGLNGLEVLSQLRSDIRAKDIPVIIATTKDLGNDLIKAYQVGADYFISKPFTPRQLRYGIKMVTSARGVGLKHVTSLD